LLTSLFGDKLKVRDFRFFAVE